jgi:eukaryotic-like serine/threonine-protein kinase
VTAVIADRYELGERLGHGGMSTVQLAFDQRLRRDVAVKLLAEHLADDPTFVERFRREALAAARLVHPNIVAVFDFGLDEASGRHYIVMEYVRGQSGAEILRDRGYVTIQEALSIVAHACRGLDYAHRHGVVHRDVKPGNLLRSDDGIVKLADFGIAKAIDAGAAITKVGSVLGTAAYLSPEQARGEDAGPASDVYALGVVAYQLMAGRLPYEATSLTELVAMQEHEAPPLLNELVDGVSGPLAAAVDRALSLEPHQRFATADDMRAALAGGARSSHEETTAATRIARRSPDRDTTRVVQRAPATASRPAASRRIEPRPGRATAAPYPTGHEPAEPRRRRRAAPLLVLLVVAALAAAGAAAALTSSGSNSRGVQLRDVTGRDAGDTIQRLRSLVNDNTQ